VAGTIRCGGEGGRVYRHSALPVVPMKLTRIVPLRNALQYSRRVGEGVVRQEANGKPWEQDLRLPRGHCLIILAKHSHRGSGSSYKVAGSLDEGCIALRGPGVPRSAWNRCPPRVQKVDKRHFYVVVRANWVSTLCRAHGCTSSSLVGAEGGTLCLSRDLKGPVPVVCRTWVPRK